MESFNFSPIGFFEGRYSNKYDAPRQAVENITVNLGQIKLIKGFNLDQALKGIEGFERIWLIYQFDQNKNWRPLTQTPRATLKQGVFATRSPYRPNPIGMSCVRLEKVGKDYILISEYDLLNGTPILDIKPYVPHCDKFEVKNSSWIEEESLKEVRFKREAEIKIQWLEKRGLTELRGFIVDQLKRDPVNYKKKRLRVLDDGQYELSYRTWRSVFRFDALDKEGVCTVGDIYSGYSAVEMLDSKDTYQDKKLHVEFGQMTFLMK